MAKDSLGQEITAGDFVAKGGRGNSASEYGMIYYKVLSVQGDTLKVVRLTCTYGPITIKVRKSTLKRAVQCVKVSMPLHAEALFEAGISGTYTTEQATLIAAWLHGQRQVF